MVESLRKTTVVNVDRWVIMTPRKITKRGRLTKILESWRQGVVMAKLFRTAKLALNEQLQRYRNKPFLEAMMAATAFLALADEKVLLSERLALDYILENVKQLKVFDVHKAVNMFCDFAETIKNDYDLGKKKVFKAVGKFSGDKEKASLIIRACVLIAKADGHFNDEEQEVVNELCRILDLESSKVCILEIEGERVT